MWIGLAPPLLTDALYLGLIRGQDTFPPDILVVPFVASYLLLMVCFLGVSLLRRVNPLARTALRGAAPAGLIVFGVLAAFSIGLPILISGIVAAIAFGLSMDRASWRSSLAIGVASALIAGAVLVVGLDVAQRVIVCPPHGSGGGSGPGLLFGPYHYQCVDGQVTYQSG